MVGKLSFCIGLPRSGKSTFCKQWQTEAPNRVVLAGDDFRYAVYNKRYQFEGEELVRGTLMTAARALFRAGYDVMIDETNTSEASIRHILMIDPTAKAYHFLTMAGVCIARAIAAGQIDLPPSIERMQKNIDQILPKIRSCEIPIVAMAKIEG